MEKAHGTVEEWVGLRLVPGVGSRIFARLLEGFGSPGQALGASVERIMALGRIPRKVAQAVSARAWVRDPRRELERLERLGVKVVRICDPGYPPLLKEIPDPPPMLFVRGDLGGVMQGGVGIVGTRRMSHYGARMARALARVVARAGLSVVSGLARGVDSVAHAEALRQGGHSVGVMGCGVDVAYPPENLELMEELASKGAVVSEWPLGTPPYAHNFPVRNRVIAGLCTAVVVVEAGLRSGALITARHALDQGREVWAVPGPVGSPTSAGCHELIKAGARVLSDPAELVDEQEMVAYQPQAQPPLPEPAGKVLEHVGLEPVHIDEIARAAGMAVQEVAAVLVNLELMGLVRGLPGKLYVREQ